MSPAEVQAYKRIRDQINGEGWYMVTSLSSPPSDSMNSNSVLPSTSASDSTGQMVVSQSVAVDNRISTLALQNGASSLPSVSPSLSLSRDQTVAVGHGGTTNDALNTQGIVSSIMPSSSTSPSPHLPGVSGISSQDRDNDDYMDQDSLRDDGEHQEGNLHEMKCLILSKISSVNTNEKGKIGILNIPSDFFVTKKKSACVLIHDASRLPFLLFKRKALTLGINHSLVVVCSPESRDIMRYVQPMIADMQGFHSDTGHFFNFNGCNLA